MLHDFVVANRDEIIRRCRTKVEMRSTPPPTAAEIDHGVPLFLGQLGEALLAGAVSSPAIVDSAFQHGHDLRRQGLTVSQVVHDYGDVCQSITDLAMERAAAITVDEFRTLNKCLDDAIASAVTSYGRERDQATFDGATARAAERMGYLAHELRNLISNAIVAFEVIESGRVGATGSTAGVLRRSLLGMRSVIARSLAEVRLRQGMLQRACLVIADLFDDLVPAARLEASARGISLRVSPVERSLALEADRDVLSAVLMNLMQNAIKFTAPGTTVTLRAFQRDGRVLVEVEDRCGGLQGVDVEVLFRPFEQGGTNRTGLGLGLAFSRWGTEANGGRISARTLPDAGCIFTVDFPCTTEAAPLPSPRPAGQADGPR